MNKYINDLIKISNTKTKIKQYLIDNFKLLDIPFPLIDIYTNNRNINFDNSYDDNIYEIKNSNNEYFFEIMKKLSSNHNFNGIICEYNKFNRDTPINDIYSIYNVHLHMCIKINILSYKNFINTISDIQNQIFKIILEYNPKLDCSKTKFIDLNNKNYLFDIDKTINFQSLKNKFINTYNTNLNSIYSNIINRSIYDQSKSSSLLYWFKSINKYVKLIEYNYILNNNEINLLDENYNILYIDVDIDLSKLLMLTLKFDKINKINLYDWKKIINE